MSTNYGNSAEDRIIALLENIWARIIDPDLLASLLQSIIAKLDSLIGLSTSILVQVTAINANTAAIQTNLNLVITALNNIKTDTGTLVTNTNSIITLLGTIDSQLVALDVDVSAIRANVATLLAAVQDIRTSILALVKNEDSPAVSGDAGIQALSVRNDTPTSSTSNDNDYQSLKTDNLGLLYVNSFRSLPFNADYLAQTNPDANGNFQTITYRRGGAGGTVVKTITLTFNAGGNVLTYLES